MPCALLFAFLVFQFQCTAAASFQRHLIAPTSFNTRNNCHPSVISQNSLILLSSSSATDEDGSSSGTQKDNAEYPAIGLVLSGGADRSFAACTGILRGLHQKQLVSNNQNGNGTRATALEAVSYISANSGGAYPAAIYSFAQVPTDELLESHRSPYPEHLTPKDLEYIPTTSMSYPITKNPISAIKKPLHFPRILANILNLRSWWSGIVYWTYLKPFGIKRGKFFAASEQEVDQIILEENQQHPHHRRRRLDKKGFIWPPHKDRRALPIMLTSMAGPWKEYKAFRDNETKITKDAWLHYKVDEILCSRGRFDRMGLNMTKCILEARTKHGGNLIVPFVISPSEVRCWFQGDMGAPSLADSMLHFPRKDIRPFEWGKRKWGTRKRFSLESAVAMSTNALGWNFAPFSHRRKLPVVNNKDKNNEEDVRDVDLVFFDGGMSDTCGVVPLVQRGVREAICVFPFNKNPPYSTYDTRYADIYNAAPSTNKSDPTFENDFKIWLSMFSRDIEAYFGYFGPGYEETCYTLLNHIFHDPDLMRLQELKIKLNLLYEAGEPLIATLEDLVVIDNPFWGIRAAGQKVNLTIIYFNMPRKFSENVPIAAVPPPEGLEKLDRDGYFTNEDFSRVPELPFNIPNKGLKYKYRQVNMVCTLGSWIVHHGWEPLKDKLGRVQFKGFKEIFDGHSMGL